MKTRAFWQTTCSALQNGRSPSWSAVADYRQPLALLLASRYSWLGPEEREDLVEDLLLAIKERLYDCYQPDRARFRTFLSAVVRNKVLAHWQRRKKQLPLEASPEPTVDPEEGVGIDLVAEVLGAVRRWYERHQGLSDRPRVYVLASRLVGGQTYHQISAREGLSVDAAKRIMLQTRNEIVADLLERGLPPLPGVREQVDWLRLARTALKALKQPRQRRHLLDDVADPGLRAGLDTWLTHWLEALERLPGTQTAAGVELREGLEILFGTPPS